MSVLVIGLNGRPLMPTTTRKARILLKKQKASVICRHPFTIHLWYKTGCAIQDGQIGIDTGSQHIGVGVTSGNRQVLKAEHALRSSMEKRSLMETRAAYRRGRRYRKTRYRKPKWRLRTKRKYFEEPDRKGRHWRKVKITTQSPRPKDPQIHREMYQRGPMYDAENLKAYVFARDGYRCACCGKKAGTIRKDGTVVKLNVHHTLFRSRGATDNPKYLTSVCDACHTAEAHKPGGILYEWMEQEKQFTRGLRDATFMNILRRRLFQAFPEAAFTYGNITSADRKRLLLPKGHANDAIAISLQGKDVDHLKNQCQTLHYKQVRKSKRSLQEATPRKGRKEPNREAKRNWKNTTEVKGFRLWDTVYVNGQKLYISGFTGTSAYLVDGSGCYISPPGKNYKQWSLSKLRRLHQNGGWLVS